MKLVIFGSTGRTGIPLVELALQAGHEVIAFVRNPEKMPIQHERLTLVQGNTLNAADIENAIQPGTDAVISVIAPPKTAPPDMLPRSVDHIIAAMRKHGIRRLIYMTGAGVSDPHDKPKLLDRIMKLALSMAAKDVVQQSIQSTDKVRQSGLDWIVVRVPMLYSGSPTGFYRVGWAGVNTGPRVNRADAAAFILKQVSDNTYLHQAPVVSD
jgi:putative NADH-flavin reductase